MYSKHLFLDVYKEYLLYAEKQQKSQSLVSLKYKFDKHILPFFENMYLEDITSKTILEWENHILKLNYSNNHNRNLYYILSGFFKFCSIFCDFDKSIISNIGCFKKKYEEDKHDFYTLEEFETFIRYVDDEVYKQFFNLLFFTGIRPGEAMALQFKDLNGEYISISKTMNSHGKREIGTPKTRSSVRKVKIDRRLKRDLLNLREIYSSKYPFNDDLFVFGGLKPLSPTTINRHKEKRVRGLIYAL